MCAGLTGPCCVQEEAMFCVVCRTNRSVLCVVCRRPCVLCSGGHVVCCVQEVMLCAGLTGLCCVLCAGGQVQQGGAHAAMSRHTRPLGALQLGPGDQPVHPDLQPQPPVQKLRRHDAQLLSRGTLPLPLPLLFLPSGKSKQFVQ